MSHVRNKSLPGITVVTAEVLSKPVPALVKTILKTLHQLYTYAGLFTYAA